LIKTFNSNYSIYTLSFSYQLCNEFHSHLSKTIMDMKWVSEIFRSFTDISRTYRNFSSFYKFSDFSGISRFRNWCGLTKNLGLPNKLVWPSNDLLSVLLIIKCLPVDDYHIKKAEINKKFTIQFEDFSKKAFEARKFKFIFLTT
jgi:hypothetical protein